MEQMLITRLDEVVWELKVTRWVALGTLMIFVLTVIVSYRLVKTARDTEQRTVSSYFLDNFDKVGKSRAVLIRYYFLLQKTNANKLPVADFVTSMTSQYFSYYVYRRSSQKLKDMIASDDLLPDTGEKENTPEGFILAVDKSRREIKEFYQTIMVMACNGLVTEDVEQKFLATRFYPTAAGFLEKYWVPVENGQDISLNDFPARSTGDILNFFKAQSQKPRLIDHKSCPR